jgi:sugar phosphate isomerase/epimerase
MNLTRRDLLATAAGAGLAIAAGPPKIKIKGMRIGVTDWNLGLSGKLEAFDLARKIGFQGVEVSLGRKLVNDKLPLDNNELIAQYREAVKKTKVQIASVCLDTLHDHPLKTDPLGRKLLGDAIPVAAKLKAPTMLLPTFGKNVPQGDAELDKFADMLKEYIPAAEKAKVILCLEDSITARENARMFDRVGSKYLQSFYDIANVLSLNVDPAQEIRFLGKARIGCVHLKDRGYLGSSGRLDFTAIFTALRDIGYSGWADLETSSPSKDIEADMRKNLEFVRGMIA